MDLKNFTVVLFVKDIEISKEFYKNILEFTVEFDFVKNVIFKNELAIWEIQQNHIISESLGFKRIIDSSANRLELYFETEDLPAMLETLKARKIKFLHEIHEEPWGQRTIRFFDPDNHLIEVGESMKQFVSRFYNQGMTIEQVSERTSVPVDDVRRLINNKS
jgi:catechol 2,3-dioxygenase-like lactoylglutathione lyase family enzyme